MKYRSLLLVLLFLATSLGANTKRREVIYPDYAVVFEYQGIKEYNSSTHYYDCGVPRIYYRKSLGTVISCHMEENENGHMVAHVTLKAGEKTVHRQWAIEVMYDSLEEKKVQCHFAHGLDGFDLIPR